MNSHDNVLPAFCSSRQMVRVQINPWLLWFSFWLLTAGLMIMPKTIVAQQPTSEPAARELLVPFNDLHLLLGNETRRVFMTREELAELKAAARHAPDEALPQKIALLSAAYDARLEMGRALLRGSLQVEVLDEGLHALPLTISGVSIRSANLDEQPAALVQGENGQVQLIVKGRGVHRLQLEMVLPVATAAAQQSIGWTVPVPPATTFHLSVPGNVEMKSGAAILNRRVDSDAGLTHFDLLPTPGAMNLVMSLNNKRLRDETTLLARGVLISEITQGYQRLHANISMNVLHGAADEFRFSVPRDYDITQVTSPLLARWSVEDSAEAPSGKLLIVKLRELVSDRTTVQLRADRLQPELGAWQMPQLEPLKVAGFASVVGIVIEDQLRGQTLESEQLIPIDNQILTAALPESVLALEPGAPRIRPLATFYAPQANYGLKTVFEVEPAELKVTTNLMLTLNDRGLEINGGLALLPASEKLFAFDIVLPAEWTVDSANLPDGRALVFQRHTAADGSRVRVELPGGLAPGATQNVLFHASHTPKDWLSNWTEQIVKLPNISIAKSANVHETGVMAVRSLDDLKLQPEAIAGLIVISDSEKSKYGCASVPLNFAWRYTEEPWQGSLKVTRANPRITGRALSFFQISPDALTAHYELFFDVDGASAQRVQFSLPESTPAEVTIRGLGDALVKDSSSQIADGRRLWKVQLADKKLGRIKLAIDFVQPITPNQLTNWTMPDVRAENVTYQSGLVAVEGDAELDIDVSVHPRSVDMGELIEAEYQVGSRLLGVYSFVGNQSTLTVNAQRRNIHGLPTTLVERAELVSLIGAGGRSQTAARFSLRTKAQYLEIRLPEGAELWSIMVDGLPAMPERQADRMVIALKATAEQALRDVRVVYEHAIGSLGMKGQVELLAPSLWYRADQAAASEEVPLVDLHWEAVLPRGYRLVRHAGTVALETEGTSLSRQIDGWWRSLTNWGGGSHAWSGIQGTAFMSKDRIYELEVRRDEVMEQVDMARRSSAAPKSSTPAAGMASAPEATAPVAAEPAMLDPFGPEPKENAQPQTPLAPTPPPAPAPVDDPFGSSPSSVPVISAPQMPQAGKQAQSAQANVSWALEGLRCLDIDLTAAKSGESIAFTSLGINPQLNVTLVNQRRWQWLGAACGLVIFLIGLALIPNRVSSRLKFAIVIVIGGLVVALATGWTLELEPVIQSLLASGIVLVTITIIAGLARKLASQLRNRSKRPFDRGTASTEPVDGIPQATIISSWLIWLMVGTFSTGALQLQAQTESTPSTQPATPISSIAELAALIDALPGNPSIAIPADAIVVPYDAALGVPEPNAMPTNAQKLLVPYETYVKLWNAAHPDQQLTVSPPAVPYAWSAAAYSATLQGEDALEVRGSFRLELFAESGVSIPLTLSGGVLQSMTVDGAPARLQIVDAAGQAPAQPPQAPAQAAQVPVPATKPSLMLLHVSGKGVKEINISIRMKIERRGGWRVIEGHLPAAPATGLTLKVPDAQTEVRLTGMSDRVTHEIDKADGSIETALPADGHAAWQWRAKIAEAAVDQGLAVDARAVFDVQEDGLRFAWQGNFEFRRGRRESFNLLVPGDYLVQKVLGSNIRGWNVQKTGDSQQLTVDLLTAVAERESLVVLLFRKYDQANGDDAPKSIMAPVIRVPDAMLQKGQLTIRRSRLLDLRSGNSNGLVRIDMPNHEWLPEQTDASPIPLVPFQAFQYSQVPYSYQLTAESMESRVQVVARTLLKLSELESSLESQLILNIADRQLYRLRVRVPKNWKLQTPATSAAIEWTHATEDDAQVLDISFAEGVSGSVPIVLRGAIDQPLTAAADGSIPSVTLPKIAVEGVSEQSGDIVVVGDPAFAIRAEQLQNCELGLLGNANSWLSKAQQPLAQLLIHYSNPDLSGQLQVTRRIPQVTAYSVSNVKVTDRSIEETLFFEFTIRTAGIRQISLVVPNRLKESRVRGPLMRTQTWTPVNNDPNASVRLVVELQEEVMGQYSLILENDRVLTSGAQSVPIPQIETGKTEHRFVTLENSGRDELLVDQTTGLERLQRSQAQWHLLAALLGGKTNEAFVVSDRANNASLSFSTKDRAIVETVGARIGIAQTLMVVDESGAYRASQEFRVENRTEQFLEIELPPESQLWTVMVAGEPVKPMTTSTPAAVGQRVRLPLVKTAAGDIDYPVLIKYGGRVRHPGGLATTQFPLVKTININVELSQVRLRLPPSMRWWNFGGSMARVQSEDELTAGWLAFRTRQLTDLTQILNKSAALDFSRARAINNLKQLGAEVEQLQNSARGRGNEDLQRQLSYNGTAWFEAQKELAKPMDVAASEQSTNRFRLNARVETQQNERSLNVAGSKAGNFDDVSHFSKADASGISSGGEFDSKWLVGNDLRTDVRKEEKPGNEPVADVKREAQSRLYKGNAMEGKDAQLAKPVAPQLQQEQAAGAMAGSQGAVQSATEGRAEQVFRYQQQLETRSNLGRGNNALNAGAMPPGQMGGGMGFGGGLGGGSGSGMGGSNMGGMGGMGGRLGGQSMPAPTAGPGGMGMGMGGMGMGGMSDYSNANQPADRMGMGINDMLADKLEAVQSGSGAEGIRVPYPVNQSMVVASPGYLVSLDTQLPVRGQEFLFSTPRGATEITAQSISTDTLQRWTALVILLVVGVGAWSLVQRLSAARFSRRTRIMLCVLGVLTGLAWLLSGYTPIFAILLIAVSVLFVSSNEPQQSSAASVTN